MWKGDLLKILLPLSNGLLRVVFAVVPSVSEISDRSSGAFNVEAGTECDEGLDEASGSTEYKDPESSNAGLGSGCTTWA